MTYNRLKVSTYPHMYTYVLLYELWWRICYSKIWWRNNRQCAKALTRSICNRTTSYSTCTAIKHHPCQPNQLTLMVARISGYWTSPYVHVFIFCSSMNESFLQKLFFFNFLAWHWRGSMAFSLLTTPDYRNTVFIREEFFDLLRDVMPGFKILKTFRRLISQTKYL